ncbi:hypothetical protein HD554DRAFT_2016154, partial [Boletus coccyginus]
SKHTFLKVIDQLPTGSEWLCELVQAHGDMAANNDADIEGGEYVEQLKLWQHDPVACMHELISNTTFQTELAYAPEKVYVDHHGRTQWYDKMWTGD